MSVFVVNKKHIVYLVLAAVSRSIVGSGSFSWVWKNKKEIFLSDTLSCCDTPKSIEVANLLYNANICSVDYRYNEISIPEKITNEDFISYRSEILMRKPAITPIQILKAIDCYIYQSCEHPDFFNSEALT